MLTDQMKALIRNFSVGAVATINPDGSPSVSPKATFSILDDNTLIFGNIRSPGTVKNLRSNPAIEICFTDVVTRQAVRVTGKAETIPVASAPDNYREKFESEWRGAAPHVSAYIKVDIAATEYILSPGYDRGRTEADIKEEFLGKINALYGGDA